ncbi:TonB-linked SusC/RagA family outer membrane protein [Flavobacterium sp. CG_23.5]|uniref:SusC/RagA family TonB-linked outer membrane protein n=1 Tax=Flavobacterium sp. CG_23.5 TaxID=2760708 RepID=UPI001AE1E48A|nr:SusC/RagA family TonB-linked outer membrane protein [Flavobacterium sp. CG_23.5]MBP2283188.1 TonB-linked SusC/RagA family outer membrane protein [Flavobacterium sp. CG_23.5]
MKLKFNGFLVLFVVLVAQLTFAQERAVSGTVSDNAGMPLPGVSVLVKGTTSGTQTDFDGKYSIKATASQVLIFSYIGMKSQEASASSTSLNVNLKDDSIELEGVVINVLGVEVKKNQNASAFSKVKGDVLTNSGETSVLKGLSAKASSVSIVSNSGDPGSGAYIQIRGQNSITGSTQPLFVIDGIPISSDEIGSTVDGVGQQSRMNDINPNDIASVQVLKGASAAALWGYRAANGVVLITTKKGKKGKISVDINSSVSFDKVNVRMKLQDRFGQGSNGVWRRNASTSFGDKISTRIGGSDIFNTTGQYFVSDNGNTIYPITKKNSTANFNDSNYDSVIGNGQNVDNHIGISGGGENTNFYLGLGSTKQEGVVRGSTYERTSIDFTSESKIGEKTSFKSKFGYSSVNSNRVQTGSNLAGLFLGLYRSPADFDNRDYKGTNFRSGVPSFNSQRAYRQDVGTFEGDLTPSYNNPLWTTNVQKNPNTIDRYIAGFEIKHDVASWMSILGRLGLDGYSDKRISMWPKNSAENGGNGNASESVTDFQQYNVDIMALGDVKVNDNIGLNYLAGVNFAQTHYDQRGGTYKNFLLDNNSFSYDNALINDKTTFLDRTYSKLSGAYFSTAFDYKDYLFLTLGGRLETSSSYSPNLKVYFYPTAEFAYKFTQNIENEVLTNGKLRLTFGQIASIPRPYAGTTYFNSAVGVEGYGGAYDSGVYNGSFQRSATGGNPNLKPEIKTEFEVGVDLEFFKRIKLSGTYYSNETKDLLVDVPLNGSSTFSSLYGNFATIQNKGVEVEFDANLLSSSSELKWNIFGNWSKNTNKVTKLEGTESLFLNGFTGSSSRAVLGQPLGVLWGGKFDRDTTGALLLDSNGFPTVANAEGVIGNPNPDWRGAIGTSISYKNIKLSTLFDASIGGQLWDGTNGALNNFGRPLETANEVTLTTPTVNSVGSLIPAGTVRGNLRDFGAGNVLLDQSWYTGLGGGFGPVAEQFVKSASWVKWRELTLSYVLKLEKAKIGFESMTFSGTGRNLWLWTEDKTLGQDPETNLTGGSNGRGLQYFNSPNTKSIIFSVNLKF